MGDGGADTVLGVTRSRVRTLFAISAAGTIAVAASFLVAPDLRGATGALLALTMVAIAAIDARRFIIPDQLSAAGFALALVNAGIQNPHSLGEAIAASVLRGAILALLFLALRIGYRHVRKREVLDWAASSWCCRRVARLVYNVDCDRDRGDLRACRVCGSPAGSGPIATSAEPSSIRPFLCPGDLARLASGNGGAEPALNFRRTAPRSHRRNGIQSLGCPSGGGDAVLVSPRPWGSAIAPVDSQESKPGSVFFSWRAPRI